MPVPAQVRLESPRVSGRLPTTTPKAGELAVLPRVGAAQQMHAHSLSDLHMEWRHLSPSAPPPPPQSAQPTARHSQPWLRAGAEQGEA